MSKKTELGTIWREFMENWLKNASEKGFPQIESDQDWPSPCEFSENDKTFWKPILQSDVLNDENSFENVGEAMEISVNAQYAEFFTLYFSEGINAQHEKGPLHLLQAWSQDDFERLQQNLIGHLMMKKKLKQAPTLFFALTDEDDLNVVVDNQSGEVCLEYVGKEPHQVLASSMAEFIQQCELVFEQR